MRHSMPAIRRNRTAGNNSPVSATRARRSSSCGTCRTSTFAIAIKIAVVSLLMAGNALATETEGRTPESSPVQGSNSRTTMFGAGPMAVAIQHHVQSNGPGLAYAEGEDAVALGSDAAALGDYAVALGATSSAYGQRASASGNGASALADDATATGYSALADGQGSMAAGSHAHASGIGAAAMGSASQASGHGSIAIGNGAWSLAENSVALGAGAVSERGNSVSVGRTGQERQIVHVAAGVVETDAVNKGQMDAGLADTRAHADATGARVEANANSYTDAHAARTLADANAHADATGARAETNANAYTDARAARTLADANAHAEATGARAETNANAYTDARAARTLVDATTHADAVGARAETNANAYTDASTTKALANANAHADATAAKTLASANAYTDTRFAAWNDDFSRFKGDLERRLHAQDRRIDRQGAMGAAMLNMAISAAGIRTDNRVGVGVGFQGGERALSVGYQRAFGERATFSLGGALSGDERSVGMGAGFGW